jgi:hypothetical protein
MQYARLFPIHPTQYPPPHHILQRIGLDLQNNILVYICAIQIQEFSGMHSSLINK